MPQWKAPRPDDKKISQPEGASSYYLDAYAAGDAKLAEDIWRDFGGKIRSVSEITDRNHNGSWNWWPLSLVAQLLASEKSERKKLIERLIHYCERQLNRGDQKHDLWGKETLSRIYPWPIPVLALAHDWARDNGEQKLEEELARLCRAHAYTLALFTLPWTFPGSPVSELYVCAPGMRSHNFEMGIQISFITACLLNVNGVRQDSRALLRAANPKVRVHWSSRVAWAASHAYLTAEDREALLAHIQTGQGSNKIVSVLNSLGVEFRTPFQVWRYKDGSFLAMAKRNVQGSTPPIMAMTRIGSDYDHLDVHPHDMRGEGGRHLGSPSKCWLFGGRVHTLFKSAKLRPGADPENLEGDIRAPRDDQEILYAVRIGQKNGDVESVHLMTEDQRDAAEQEQLQNFRLWAGGMKELLEGKPDEPKILQHGQAIARLADTDPLNTLKIYKHAKAIERREPDKSAELQKKVHAWARRIADLYEWWA